MQKKRKWIIISVLLFGGLVGLVGLLGLKGPRLAKPDCSQLLSNGKSVACGYLQKYDSSATQGMSTQNNYIVGRFMGVVVGNNKSYIRFVTVNSDKGIEQTDLLLPIKAGERRALYLSNRFGDLTNPTREANKLTTDKEIETAIKVGQTVAVDIQIAKVTNQEEFKKNDQALIADAKDLFACRRSGELYVNNLLKPTIINSLVFKITNLLTGCQPPVFTIAY